MLSRATRSECHLAVVAMVMAMVVGVAVCAGSVPDGRVNLEWDAVPGVGAGAGWKQLGQKPHPHQTVNVVFALKHRNRAHMEKLFWEVSDPEHEKYGQYLSHEEVGKLYGPSERSVSQVQAWLRSHGVADHEMSVTPNREFVHGALRVSSVESALQTRMGAFAHPFAEGRVVHRAMEHYSVPAEIAEHVHVVLGMHGLPKVTAPKHHQAEEGLQAMAEAEDDATAAVMEGSLRGPEPLVLAPQGGDMELAAVFEVRCKDGNNTGAPLDRLCADRPGNQPHMVGAEVIVEPWSNSSYLDRFEPFKLSFTVAQMKCVQNGTRNTICYAPIRVRVHNFRLHRVKVRQMFADKTYSKFVWSLHAGVASPWASLTNLRQFYRIPQGQRCTNERSSVAVAEFLDQFYDPADLTEFQALNGEAASDVRVEGPNDATKAGGEASLDIQYVQLARGARHEFWSQPGRDNDGQETFHEWMLKLAGHANPPLVHSVSFADDENTISEAYRVRLDEEFKKAGLRGVSILFSSGDDGAVGSRQQIHRQGRAACVRAGPAYPSASPYVTSVGATQFSTRINRMCAERSAGGVSISCPLGEVVSSTITGSHITSGGGFSDVYPAPAYQRHLVKAYLESQGNGLPPASFYNSKGRGYPDVSVVGHQYPVLMKLKHFLKGIADTTTKRFYSVDGTSASAPVMAAIVTLINDARMNTNQKPLGFLNPWIYGVAMKHPEAFNDVVYGDNRCGRAQNKTGECCEHGFAAAPGWDPATGVGSPRFDVLFNVALNPAAMFPLNGRAGHSLVNYGLYHPDPVETTWLWVLFILLLVGMIFLAAFSMRNSRELRLIRLPGSLISMTEQNRQYS